MILRKLLALALFATAALGSPSDFSMPCRDHILSERIFVPGTMLFNSLEKWDVEANTAVSEGRLLDALAVVKKGISYWKRQVRSASGGELRGQHLNGLRWLQMSAVPLFGMPNFPVAELPAHRKWIDDELLQSADWLVDHYGVKASPASLAYGQKGLRIASAAGLPLQDLITTIETIIPGEPYQLIYSPDALTRSSGAAGVEHSARRFLLSHYGMTHLAPGHHEVHEVNHLRLESFLVAGLPSYFYGFDRALTAALPGPRDPYSEVFSHNEPYNYQEDARAAIGLYQYGKAKKKKVIRDEALERLLDAVGAGFNTSLRQITISNGLSQLLAAARFQQGPTISVSRVNLKTEDGLVLFETPCMGMLNDALLVGLHIQTRGNGRKIPWFVAMDGGRLYSIPLLDFPLATAETLIRDLGLLESAVGTGSLSQLGSISLTSVRPMYEAAELAARAYAAKAANAQSMKTAFESVYEPGKLWLASPNSTHRLKALSDAMAQYESFVVPATIP